MADYKFYAFFTASKTGKTGLTVTVDVRNSAGTLVVTDGSASAIGGGLYGYTHTSATADDYTAVFKTADSTVDAQHVPSLVPVQLPRIDAAVSSRADATDYTTTRAAKLDNLDIAISTRMTLGAGGTPKVYTLTDGTNPIADADVWVTTDTAGANVIASGRTDSFGQVTFMLDSGTCYIWRQKSGWDFINPDTEVV